MHLLIGILAALIHREKTGEGQKVFQSMQDAVLNLCRVKLRDQERLALTGVLKEYPQFPKGTFGDTVPRSGNSSGGGSAGWVLKCKNWKTDPNDYIYIILQAWGWKKLCDAIGKPQWKTDKLFATPEARGQHIMDVFGEIETWLADKDKYQAVALLRKADVPVGPVLSMKEIADDPSLRANGSIVEVEEELRGKYLTVGCPMKFSAFTPKITGAPLLGEHNQEVLTHLGYSASQIAELHQKGVI